jgi:UDP-GlcNAc3NAcA epimerase
MEDAALYFSQKIDQITAAALPGKPYILATIHRAENTDNPETLQNILSAINQLAETCEVVLPLHPRTKTIIRDSKLPLNFDPIEPVGYFQMLRLIRGASLVLTDSGGLQKEAFFFRKYCITLREETEWTELVENGYNHVAGSNRKLITTLAQKYFGKEIKDPLNLYGRGMATDFISKVLLEL